jgi:kynurenine formamidase
MTPADLDALYERLKNWGRWGYEDDRGALNFITREHVATAARLVRSGESVSLAHDLPTTPSSESPFPAHHHMLAAGDARDSNGIPGYEASRDYVGTDVHGLGITHIDALCHMFVRGEMFNGLSADLVKSTGSSRNTIMSAENGISGRGVLLDVAAARGRSHIEPSTQISVSDLEAAEAAEGVQVREGDLLVVAAGRDTRRAAAGGVLDPVRAGLAGLGPDCLEWLFDRKVAVLGSDGISDPMPPAGIANWPFPIHQIGIVAIGLHLVDNLRLDGLIEACQRHGRYEFFLTIAPMRIPGGTGCPVNPIAMF